MADKPICAIGLMSGTSMDGIDIAVLRSDGDRHVERGPSAFVAYDAVFRRRIEAALGIATSIEERAERPGDLADLEREITLRHAEAVARFRADHCAGSWAPSVIGFHGQTVLHRPARALTVQLADGSLLADRCGLAVVYDMRAADMKVGGQGAPLVPAYHAALGGALGLGAERFPLAFVNIGGISNVTFVPLTGDPVAFDSGPGNALIDQWVSAGAGIPFDADGAVAREGGVVDDVVATYLADPFFERPAPKSLDRNDFTLDAVRGLELSDGARTLAAVSGRAIAKAADAMPERPRTWILCGGGRKNPHIVAELTEAVAPSAIVKSADSLGLDGDAMEAEAWAYLAIRSLRGLPLTFPGTTGCRRPTTGGVLARPAGMSVSTG